MARRKNKKQSKKQNTNPKQVIKHDDPEVRVNYEEISTLDIINQSDNDINKITYFLAYAKKNPEYVAFIFTVFTTAVYFIIRAFTFTYYLGQSFYYKFDCKFINVNNDYIIFLTIPCFFVLVILFIISDKINQKIQKHPILLPIIGVIVLSFIIFFGVANKNTSMSLTTKIIASFVLSILFVYNYCFFSVFLPNIINKKIKKTAQNNVAHEINTQLRSAIFLIFFGVVIFTLSLFLSGYNKASNQKSFKTLKGNYIVLYMNDEIAVCSPYEEENNCITINKSIHKNFELSDIEFETREFEKVKLENVR